MRIRTCIFPVAGLGTRFLPATKSIPKEMLVVVDKPLIQYAVEEAKAAGVERFVFITSMGKTAIEDHFDSDPLLEQHLMHRQKSAELELIQSACLMPGQAVFIRQHKPLGLGHAVLCAKDLIDDDAFAVILADDLVHGATPCIKQMIDDYQLEDGNMVAVIDVDPSQVSNYGILGDISIQGKKMRAKSIEEKPKIGEAKSNMAVIGRYILQRSVFDTLKYQVEGAGGEIQLTDAISKMMTHTPLSGFNFEGKRFDCGTKLGWLQANLFLALEDSALKEHLFENLRNVI